MKSISRKINIQAQQRRIFLSFFVEKTYTLAIDNIKRKRVKELWSSKAYRKLPYVGSTVKNEKFIEFLVLYECIWFDNLNISEKELGNKPLEKRNIKLPICEKYIFWNVKIPCSLKRGSVWESKRTLDKILMAFFWRIIIRNKGPVRI